MSNPQSERPRPDLASRLPDWAEPFVDLVLAVERIAHLFLAALVFAGGIALLLSGAGPVDFARIDLVRDVVPLPFAESSHLFSSLVGLALIILARGLALRMTASWTASIALLLSGSVFSLFKGFQWEEALLLIGVASLLYLSRGAFYRHGDWRSFRPGPTWLAVVALTVAAVIFIGFMAFKNTGYRGELWWSFSWSGDASRFLRVSLALAVMTSAIALDSLLNRVRPKSRLTGHSIPEEVRNVLAEWPESQAQVALLGDKDFLISPSKDAFIMYAVAGRSFVSLGGPIGANDASAGLIWEYLELADRYGVRPVFYGVGPNAVLHLLDLGHTIVKFGEMARVDLHTFSLDGSARKSLRYARTRAAREGLIFDILPKGGLLPHMGELKSISDQWLASRTGREKSFSLGRFDIDYLAEFDIAVMRHQDRIVAFANLWNGGNQELSPDLMRYVTGQSPVLMEAFMTEIILHAQANGFRWFNLGGAPLSGLANHPLAPLWSRMGNYVYRHGDDFYGFEGLRAFKEKFGPEWAPRYLTFPRGISMARAVLDVALLISRPRH